MRILRTLCSHDFKLQPFPDERLDSNPVCSTGVHSYPSASNIQRMASVFWRDDGFSYFFFSFSSSHWSAPSHQFLPRAAHHFHITFTTENWKKKKKKSLSFTHTTWQRWIMLGRVWHHVVTSSAINHKHSSLITWTSWQEVPGRSHPPTRPRILRCFSEGHGLSARRRGKLNISFSRWENERVWNETGVCFRFLCGGDAFVCAWQWQSTDQRSGGTVTNAWVEWLTAPDTSPLLISRVFADKSCLSHLKSGGANRVREPRSCSFKPAPKNRVICDTCAPQALNSPGMLEDAPACQSSARATRTEVKAGTRAGAAVNTAEARLGLVLQVKTLWTLHLLDPLFVLFFCFFFPTCAAREDRKYMLLSLALLPHEWCGFSSAFSDDSPRWDPSRSPFFGPSAHK